MTTLQVNAQIPFESLLGSLTQLSAEELDAIFRQTAILKARQHAPSLSSAETSLLNEVYNTQIPTELKTRCRSLSDKQKVSPLSKAERAELENVIDQIEVANATRLSHLIQLAALRDVTLDTLIAQLELTPLSYE